ncbi:MAG: patatin [Hyphomicrobiaceae bacterium]|nr:MAG: patatin [Hyphomicrobiaceae bacterium]
MRRSRIGLALGSGSARGWSHIGVLEALQEAGIRPDVVCGASIGALVGAAYVADRLQALKDFAESVTWREIVSLLDVRVTGGGLISGKQIVELLRRLKIDAAIDSYATPYAAIATDLESGREVWLREGPIEDAVRASISLPGIFSPVRNADRWLVDGGLVNPVPVSTCRALGADIVLAVNLNGDLVGRFDSGTTKRTSFASISASPEFVRKLLGQIPPGIREQASAIAPKLLRSAPASPGYFDVLTNAINVMQDQITRARLAGEPPHVMLVPRLRDIGLLEFNRATEAIAEGRACVEQALPALRRYI